MLIDKLFTYDDCFEFGSGVTDYEKCTLAVDIGRFYAGQLVNFITVDFNKAIITLDGVTYKLELKVNVK